MNKSSFFLLGTVAIIALLIASGFAIIDKGQVQPVPSKEQRQPDLSTLREFAPKPEEARFPGEAQKPVDTRSWGERLRHKGIPLVPGVEWQTYTNLEYGFQMEYPKRLMVNTYRSSEDALSYIYFDRSNDPYDTFLSIVISHKSLREFIQNNTDLNQRFNKEDLIPDVIIHELNVIIESPDIASDRVPLRLYFEKEGYSYGFIEVSQSDEEDDRQIIEHMIKTLRFVE